MALSNAAGVEVLSAAASNTIGGTEAGAGNQISGNTVDGVSIHDAGTSQNNVEGNLIGTTFTGTVVLGNADGVEIDNGATGNTIGGTEAGALNLISGNLVAGVAIHDATTGQNKVEGNFIGTDISGAAALSNPVGVSISNAPGNTVGGAEAVPGT